MIEPFIFKFIFPYFSKRIKKIHCSQTFVFTNTIGFDIDLSTCDSAAKCITLSNLYLSNRSSINFLSVMSPFINL